MRYFGTDGVRGTAGVDLTAELAFKLGRAAGLSLKPKRALIGRDTRTSGPALEAACSAGLAETGCHVFSAGIIPSPAISHLVRLQGFHLGAVISASHNPPEDNGIKFYSPDGLKLPPDAEQGIEENLDVRPQNGPLGPISPWDEARELYVDFLLSVLGRGWGKGLRVVLDCAHGATAAVAPEVFSSLGIEVTAFGTELDGKKINATGVMNMGPLQELVRAEGADLGVAFDGDGDRALFVTSKGEVVEGDRLLGALAPHLLSWGEISSPAVVFTVLANRGPEEYLRAQGFTVPRVPVGDRNVSLKMKRSGIEVGGEPSGHIVFGRYSPTGDGILTALYLLRALKRLGFGLEELVRPVPLYPQLRRDIPAGRLKGEILGEEEVKRAIAEAERALGDSGRVAVRPSGTQPLIRVLVEGPDEGRLTEALEGICEAIKKALARRSGEGL
ncbi:phosphoglucosamine mutase [Candidatus Acetothermia bacterium]|nr:MAG: phosphoglucosamine mutase [Candidatus Acetothermia bacterium]